MNLIVAVDRNWAIGRQNRLLVSIPADMRFFRDETMGKVVVMGRKTMESFQGGQPLSNRVNIVITSKKEKLLRGGIVVHSVKEALEQIVKYKSKDVYIIGGGSVYEQMLPFCDVAYVTKINFAYEADTYFPNLDSLPQWKQVEQSEEQTYYDLEYQFCKYENVNKYLKN